MVPREPAKDRRKNESVQIHHCYWENTLNNTAYMWLVTDVIYVYVWIVRNYLWPAWTYYTEVQIRTCTLNIREFNNLNKALLKLSANEFIIEKILFACFKNSLFIHKHTFTKVSDLFLNSSLVIVIQEICFWKKEKRKKDNFREWCIVVERLQWLFKADISGFICNLLNIQLSVCVIWDSLLSESQFFACQIILWIL